MPQRAQQIQWDSTPQAGSAPPLQVQWDDAAKNSPPTPPPPPSAMRRFMHGMLVPDADVNHMPSTEELKAHPIANNPMIPGTGVYRDIKAGNYAGALGRVARPVAALAPFLFSRGEAEVPGRADATDLLHAVSPEPISPRVGPDGSDIRVVGHLREAVRLPEASSPVARATSPETEMATRTASPIAKPSWTPPRASQFNPVEIGGPEDVAETRAIQEKIRDDAEQETDALRKRGNEEGFARNTRQRIAKGEMTKNFREEQGFPTEEKPVKLTTTKVAKPGATASGRSSAARGSNSETEDLTDLLEESVKQAKAKKAAKR